jgi:diguanylate cyclase (GGDEF)-like protein
LLHALAQPIAHALARTQRLADLEQLSYTDELTRLYNARYWREWLAKELARAQRERSQLAVLFFDLDNFKDINDAYGHLVGSHVLQECGAILMESVRASDVAARYGGDEFVVILPSTDLERAIIVAKRLRQNLARHRFDGGQELSLRLTASFGIACYPLHAHTPYELIARADAAMYTAKAAGKNRLRHAPDG